MTQEAADDLLKLIDIYAITRAYCESAIGRLGHCSIEEGEKLIFARLKVGKAVQEQVETVAESE